MLVGLNGRLGAGKNTAANRLAHIEALNDKPLPVEFRAFAAPLKVSAAALFGLTVEELETLKRDPHYSFSVTKPDGEVVMLTGRHYLERYGTEAHRDVFGTNFWLDQTVPPNFNHDGKLVLVTDCRFQNEAERIQGQGGMVVEIVGPEGRKGNGHVSDQPLPDLLIDTWIDNSIQDDNYLSLDIQLGDLLAQLDVLDGVL